MAMVPVLLIKVIIYVALYQIARCSAIYLKASSSCYAPLYRYYSNEHFYTIDIKEIGTAVPGAKGHHGYFSEGVQCLVATKPGHGLMPLYRYWNGRDHFYTTNVNEIGTCVRGHVGKYGYVSEGIAAYCYAHQEGDNVPLHRYGNGVDHFYTTDAGEIGTTKPGETGKYGYVYEGVTCYVLPYCGVVHQ